MLIRISSQYLPGSGSVSGWELPDGVTGNTLDFDSRKSRFEPWSGNCLIPIPIPKSSGWGRDWDFSLVVGGSDDNKV